MGAAILRSAAPGLAYQAGMRCPSCWSSNWLVGRSTAECGHCGQPLFLAPFRLPAKEVIRG